MREGRGWMGTGWEDGDWSEQEGGSGEGPVGGVEREERERIGFARAVYYG